MTLYGPNDAEDDLMREALALADRGRFEVEPNPRVGCLLLKDGEVVARGWHEYFGGRHAEALALEEAREKGVQADTAVVTLEPCSTEKGADGKKTPPCAQALVEAGVQRVVIGAVDPDPRHRRAGIDLLEAAGLDVLDGVLASKCDELYAPFRKALQLDRPWMLCKWAMTLDGKTAAPTGEARWISGPASRERVHRLRAAVDAILVGSGTALADDPELTARRAGRVDPTTVLRPD